MKLRFTLFSLALISTAALSASHVPDPEWTGRILERTGDGPGLQGEPKHEFILHNRKGERKRLHLGEDLLKKIGGRRALRGREVEVQARPGAVNEGVSENLSSPNPVEAVSAVGGGELAEASAQAISGPKPWVSILVKYQDVGAEPQSKAWFVSRMATDNVGMDKLWRENSYNQMNLGGSLVVGWYVLPRPKSYYFNPDGNADLDKVAADALAVADGDVNYNSYAGVNVMINDTLGCCAWGGGYYVGQDGANRNFSFTWMPPWGFQADGVLAQEMGHGFGLPHSSGPYGATYDSQWDFMSGSYGVAPHTVSFHKTLLAWIPGSRTFVPAAGTVTTIFIERLALPPFAAGSYQMARLPISGSNRFYTLESRLKQGLDVNVPGESVLIHDVDSNRGDRNAQVVDATNNNDPNDAGAMWIPGETFNDAANQISVEVLSSNASGHSVRISYKANAPTPTFTPTAVPANGNGACASYWNNRTLTGAACAMRTEAQIAFDWGSGGPAGTSCGAITDNFSARFQASLEAPYAGTYTLYLSGDDGIRLWVTNPANNVETLLINQWIDQGPTEYSAVLPFSLNAGQRAPIRAEFYENGGGALVQLSYSGPNTPKQLVPQGRLYSGACALPTNTPTFTATWTNTPTPTWTPTAPAANGNGLCATYWSNKALSGDACAMRTEATLNFNWSLGGPAGLSCGPITDNFSIRALGQLEAPYSGTYTLYLRGDDGIRLWATNPATNIESLLIDQWQDQGSIEFSAVLPFSLSAGQRAPIRVEFYENGGYAELSLSYSGPNTPKQVVPQGRLYSGACVLATPTSSDTPTVTHTATETRTYTWTSTSTDTSTITETPTHTATFTNSFTASDTATFTNSHTATNSFTRTNTFTSTNTFTPTNTFTSTRTFTSTATATKTSTPTFTPAAPPANGNGACASYWSNRTLSGSACAMRTEPQVNLNWGSSGPAGTPCGAITDNFSARFTAALEAPFAGAYTLYLAGDDGIRLWVTNPANNVESLLIDKWIDQGVTEYSAALPFSLAAGQRAPIRVEYYENGGGALVSLSWSGPGFAKQVVPQGRLYSSGCVLPTATPTPSAAVQVEFRIPDTGPTSGSPHPQFLFGNRGTSAIQLTEYEIRYWFTCDCGGVAMQAALDWTSIPGTLVDLQPTSLGGQTHYVRVRFTQGYGLLPGANAEIHTRYNRADWANVTQTNDWSFTPTGAYAVWNKVTVYRLGAKVWGLEPGQAALENLAGAKEDARTVAEKEAAQGVLGGGKKIVAGPNPASGEIQVAYKSAGGRIRLSLLNWMQEPVAQKDLGETPAGENREPFSLAGLPSGVYHLVLMEDLGQGWKLKGNFKVAVKRP